jgi:hypothetical protein
MTLNDNPSAEQEDHGAFETTREAETEDVAEPDAPTAADANPGMNTILNVEPLTGVQSDKSDE